MSPSSPASSWWRDLALLALALGALFFFRLGSYPFSNPDEGRYAEIPREMLATGDFVTPRLDGVNYFEKPPLVYWVTAASERLFGLNEWAVRAVPVLFALWGVLLTYTAARRLHGRNAGLAAAVVLGTSVLWFVVGHIPILDMAVSVFMAWALFSFLLAVREPAGPRRRWLFYQLYTAMALATLTKGFMGFLVTGAVMFLWLLVCHQWKRLRPLHLPTGALLFLAIAAPWHVLAALRNPTWAHRYIVYEHFLRFLTDTATGHAGPWWYFIPIVLLGLFPWTGFLLAAGRDALRGGWARRAENAEAWFFVTWAGFIFLFFSASHSKLAPYILPIFPALAMLIGAWLARTIDAAEGAKRFRFGLGVFAFVCGLLAVALVVVVARPALVRMDAPQAQALQVPAFTMAAVLLLGGIVAPWLAKRHGPRPALAALVATVAAMFVGLQFAAPQISKPGTKSLALFVREHARPGDRVVHYHDFSHDFTFYAGRTVDVVDGKGELEVEEDAAAQASGRFMSEADFRRLWDQPGRIFAVARKRDVETPPGTAPAGAGPPLLFADPTFHYLKLAESPDHILFSNQP